MKLECFILVAMGQEPHFLRVGTIFHTIISASRATQNRCRRTVRAYIKQRSGIYASSELTIFLRRNNISTIGMRRKLHYDAMALPMYRSSVTPQTVYNAIYIYIWVSDNICKSPPGGTLAMPKVSTLQCATQE